MDNEEKKETIINEVNVNVPKNKIKSVGLIKILIIVAVASVLFGGSFFGISRVFNSQEKVLKLGLDDVGELVTQTCHTVVLEDSKESVSFFDMFDIPFTESRQIFSYDFDVDASINFSLIEIEKIDDSKKEVTIKVPHAKVYKVVILPETFKSYLDTNGLFSRIDLTEHNDALLKMEELAKNQCLESKLLDRADENTQKLLSSMIKSEKKYKDYSVIYNYIEETDQENNKADANLPSEEKIEE